MRSVYEPMIRKPSLERSLIYHWAREVPDVKQVLKTPFLPVTSMSLRYGHDVATALREAIRYNSKIDEECKREILEVYTCRSFRGEMGLAFDLIRDNFDGTICRRLPRKVGNHVLASMFAYYCCKTLRNVPDEPIPKKPRLVSSDRTDSSSENFDQKPSETTTPQTPAAVEAITPPPSRHYDPARDADTLAQVDEGVTVALDGMEIDVSNRQREILQAILNAVEETCRLPQDARQRSTLTSGRFGTYSFQIADCTKGIVYQALLKPKLYD
mmetsp:Transcript_3048/g.5851  ORF Transcript_3048/g.5851 Transcript_3048/m.5851 type:complete len:270 (-) Transcript_3048:3219-4028(-)